MPLGTLTVTCKPDHLLRCGTWPASMVDIVTHERTVVGSTAVAWGQLIGKMIAAAVSNDLEVPAVESGPIFGIGIVGTRWTFLRAEFSKEYLERLVAYELRPSDRFSVWAWGGAMSHQIDDVRRTESSQWGLDYTNFADRLQLVRMVVALGEEARALVQKVGL